VTNPKETITANMLYRCVVAFLSVYEGGGGLTTVGCTLRGYDYMRATPTLAFVELTAAASVTGSNVLVVELNTVHAQCEMDGATALYCAAGATDTATIQIWGTNFSCRVSDSMEATSGHGYRL
jgi:hypothetical protein